MANKSKGEKLVGTKPKLRALFKPFKLTEWAIILGVILLGTSGVIYQKHEQKVHQEQKLALASSQSSSAPESTGTSTQPAQPATPATSATPTPTVTPRSSSVSSCTSVVETRTSDYNIELSDIWTNWNKSTTLTPAEINYEYNQYAQQSYNANSQAIRAAGCTSNLTLSLKYPATNPEDAGSSTNLEPTYIPPTQPVLQPYSDPTPTPISVEPNSN